MTDTVHDFVFPIERLRPIRDMVLIQLPLSPKKVGSLIVPDFSRDMAQHNVIYGRVVAAGPLAFAYKDIKGEFVRQPVSVGDWVIFRPYAGTQTVGGKISISNWRYLSSFQDVIGLVPADKMPDPATLFWNAVEVEAASVVSASKIPASFGGEPRERVKVNNARS